MSLLMFLMSPCSKVLIKKKVLTLYFLFLYIFYCDAQYILCMYCLNSFVVFEPIIFSSVFTVIAILVIGRNMKIIIGLLVSARVVISVHP